MHVYMYDSVCNELDRMSRLRFKCKLNFIVIESKINTYPANTFQMTLYQMMTTCIPIYQQQINLHSLLLVNNVSQFLANGDFNLRIL